MTIPFYLEEISTFRSELAMYISARIGVFRKGVDSLEIGAKTDRLALLPYVEPV